MFRKRFFINYSKDRKAVQPPLQHIEIINKKVGVQWKLRPHLKGIATQINVAFLQSFTVLGRNLDLI